LPGWTRVGRRMQRRIAESAAPFLAANERLRIGLFAQDTPIRGRPLLFLSLANRVGHLVIGATDRRIYVFSRGFLANGKVRGVLRIYPLGSTPVRFRRGWGELTIGPDRYWISALAAQGDAQDFVALVTDQGSYREARP
jgi:hypothetical protein